MTVIDLAEFVAAATYPRSLDDRPHDLPCRCAAVAAPQLRAPTCAFHRVTPTCGADALLKHALEEHVDVGLARTREIAERVSDARR